MQTLDFTRALTEIVAELRINELFGLMKSWLLDQLPVVPNTPPNQHHIPESAKGAFASLLFQSHAGYDRLSRVHATGKILDGMEIKELYEPSRLARIMNLVSNTQLVEQLRSSGSAELFDFLETLKALIRIEKTCKALLEVEKIGKTEPTDSLLELQVADYEGKGVEPERLSAAFSILADLQMNIGRLLRVNNDRLIVKYLDSGTDFKIGLEGVTEAIDALRNLMESIWDRIRFRDHDSFERNIEAVTKGLDFLEKVKQAVESEAVTQEEADNLKARVFRGVNDLIGLGVTLPIGGEGADVERKQLIEKRSTKLLTAGDGAPSEPTADSGPQQAD